MDSIPHQETPRPETRMRRFQQQQQLRRRRPGTRRTRPFLLALALAALLSSGAAEARQSGDAGNAKASPIDLDLYDAILGKYTQTSRDVVGVRVDYRALRGQPEWKRLVRSVRTAKPSRLGADASKAFWINAYNILTIDLILDHYPLDSIKSIGSFLSPVWDRAVADIEGKARSLGEIEHEILRPLGDPRIHAAIVCASTSCPPLARTAFRPERLDEDLDAAMRRWLESAQKGVRIDRKSRTVRVSKIFDWFEEDFEAGGGVLATIARFVPAEDAAWLRGPGRKARIRYFSYDWSLNETASR